jgi:hypothetical protein
MEDIVVDARWLEPPEPLERVLAALERRTRHQRVRLLIHREPYPLYDILRQMGLAHHTRPQPDGCYEVLIHEPQDAASA